MTRRSFLLDLNRCTGCQACRLACTIENRLEPGASWRQIITYNPRRAARAPTFHLSLACNHCRRAPCMQHCPSRAIRRDAMTGAVLVEPTRCLGCGYCTWLCPFDAAHIDPGSRVMAKCTLCQPRLLRGQRPACVVACPTGALDHSPEDPRRDVRQVPGFDPGSIEPALRFVPLRPTGTRPRILPTTTSIPTGQPDHAAERPADAVRDSITLRREWPLVVFSLAMAGLVGAATAAAAGALTLSLPAFLMTALAALAAATCHLGRPGRAWRALLNVRHSWLSREIALTLAFIGVTTVWILGSAPEGGPSGPDSRMQSLAWLGALLGLAALWAIDRVYAGIRPHPGRSHRPGAESGPPPSAADGSPRFATHSAEVLLTGTLLVAVLTRTATAAGLFAGLKLLLSVRWLVASRGRISRGRLQLAAIRLVVGIVLPAAIWAPTAPPHGAAMAAILVAFAAGEIIDRIEFYRSLSPIRPHEVARRHLAAHGDWPVADSDLGEPATG